MFRRLFERLPTTIHRRRGRVNKRNAVLATISKQGLGVLVIGLHDVTPIGLHGIGTSTLMIYGTRAAKI